MKKYLLLTSMILSLATKVYSASYSATIPEEGLEFYLQNSAGKHVGFNHANELRDHTSIEMYEPRRLGHVWRPHHLFRLIKDKDGYLVQNVIVKVLNVLHAHLAIPRHSVTGDMPNDAYKDHRLFIITPADPGSFYFYNPKSGQYLTSSGADVYTSKLDDGDKKLKMFKFEIREEMAALLSSARTAEASVRTLSAGMESLQVELKAEQDKSAKAISDRIAAETDAAELRTALAAAKEEAAKAKAEAETARRENEERRRAATHRARSSSPFAARTEDGAARSTSRVRTTAAGTSTAETGAGER